MEAKTVIASIGKDQNYKTELKTDTHTYYADEPLSKGGQDMAPSPTDLLRMSLASCTAITLRMYADHKNIEIDTIKVMVVTEDIKDKTIFHRNIQISGDLTDEQHTRMLQIANACPVHKVLTATIAIETSMSLH
jgi:putative redox protein